LDLYAARPHGLWARASQKSTAKRDCVRRHPKSPICVSRWYQPFARQDQFHRSGAKYRLFGGAAGPGKTKALLWEAIGQANDHPGCDTLLLRRTYPELESSLLAYFRRDVPRTLYRSYNEAKHVVSVMDRPRLLVTAATKMTSTSIKVRSFCSSGSMSSRTSR
jgi:hypothetical protein